jgi:quercetin dioxygenase-like cupin family protein
MVLMYHEQKGLTMTHRTTMNPLVRGVADAEQRWFAGGGVHSWLATAEDTDGAFLLFSDVMDRGKRTPLHTHPVEESLYVVDGEILVHLDGDEHRVGTGGLAVAPRGVPHAFLVLSETATVLTLQTPGTCQAFYLGASVPLSADTPRVVDFDRVMASAATHGGIDIIGPPPFPAG